MSGPDLEKSGRKSGQKRGQKSSFLVKIGSKNPQKWGFLVTFFTFFRRFLPLFFANFFTLTFLFVLGSFFGPKIGHFCPRKPRNPLPFFTFLVVPRSSPFRGVDCIPDSLFAVTHGLESCGRRLKRLRWKAVGDHFRSLFVCVGGALVTSRGLETLL